MQPIKDPTDQKGGQQVLKKQQQRKKTARGRQKQKRPINVGKLRRAWHPYEQGKKRVYPTQDQSQVQMMQQEKGQRGQNKAMKKTSRQSERQQSG